jgi:hypothetical protein
MIRAARGGATPTGYLGRLFEQDKFEVIGRGLAGLTGSFFHRKTTPDAVGQALAHRVRSINLGPRIFPADFAALPAIMETRDAV